MIANASQAAEFCDVLTKAAKGVPSKFRQYRGGSDGSGDYVSTLVLPNADECYIQRQDGYLVCDWNLDIKQDAIAQAKTLSEGIRACYPEAKGRTSERAKKTSAYTYSIRGVEFGVGYDESRNRVTMIISGDD